MSSADLYQFVFQIFLSETNSVKRFVFRSGPTFICLDPGQDWQNLSPDLDPNCLQMTS